MASVALLKEVAKSTLATIFTLEPSKAVHRTAVFMIIFLCVHLSGNMVFFLGRDAFNQWWEPPPRSRTPHASLIASFSSPVDVLRNPAATLAS